MNNKHKPSQSSNKEFLMKYAGLGTQLLVAIGLSVFVGLKIDKWLHTSPLFACVLPLLVLSAIFYKLFKETSRKNNNE
ncbi:MAG: AtpZ/AtpI family protein [Chitinophagaceae bacterium]|nr:AtpZ/AtpI family protein [Chitinophagaceae bacterium]